MALEFEKVSLANLAAGHADELFHQFLRKLIPNVMDVATNAKAKRVFTLEVTFEPTEDRDFINVDMRSKEKLAAPKPQPTVLQIARDQKGAAALYTSMLKQDVIPGFEKPAPTLVTAPTTEAPATTPPPVQ